MYKKLGNFFIFCISQIYTKHKSCLGAMAKKTLTTAQVVNVQIILMLPL